MIKNITLLLLGITLPLSVNKSAIADTMKVQQNFAIKKVVEIEVTPFGLLLDLKSTIGSLNISHTKDVVISGFNGILCNSNSNCPENAAPSILYLRKIPPLETESSINGKSMLFVNTDSGVYRFEITPTNEAPKYTKVSIVGSGHNLNTTKKYYLKNSL